MKYLKKYFEEENENRKSETIKKKIGANFFKKLVERGLKQDKGRTREF